VDGAGLSSMSEGQMLLVSSSHYVTDVELDEPDWQIGVAGDDASAGLWVRADPIGTNYNGLNVQPEDDHTAAPGVNCFVTGNGTSGGSAGEEDVDDGCTTLVTPTFDLTGVDRAFVSYWRWYGEGGNSTDDDFVVEVTNNGGGTWIELDRVVNNANNWHYVAYELGPLDGGSYPLTDQMQLRFLACDNNTGGLVEAAIDDLEVATFTEDVVSIVGDDQPGSSDELPRFSQLVSVYPNPFNPTTNIAFVVPREMNVRIEVVDVRGRLVDVLTDGTRVAGDHTVTWSAEQQASGVYFARLVADDRTQVRRLSLVK